MTKIVTATIQFTINEELEDELEGTSPALYDRMLEMHIWRCLDDEHHGVAEFQSAKVTVTNVCGVEEA
jgi:hypothetical protein